MAFRHRKFSSHGTACSNIVTEVKTVITNEEVKGRVTRRATRQDKPMSIKDSEIPTEEEYTLQALLNAGVPLNQVPTKIMNPTDPHTVQMLKDTYGETLFNKFLDEEWKHNTEEIKAAQDTVAQEIKTEEK